MNRSGFSIIYSIFIVVVLGTILTYSLHISSLSAKSISDEHIKIQLKLYLESATELTMLWLSGDKTRSQNESNLSIAFDNLYEFNISITPINEASNIQDLNGSVIADIIGKTTFLDTPYTTTKRVLLKP